MQLPTFPAWTESLTTRRPRGRLGRSSLALGAKLGDELLVSVRAGVGECCGAAEALEVPQRDDCAAAGGRAAAVRRFGVPAAGARVSQCSALEMPRRTSLVLLLNVLQVLCLLGCKLFTRAHAAASPTPPPVVVLDTDWPDFLSRHDPLWRWRQQPADDIDEQLDEAPPNTWQKSLFGGNAMLGFMMWQPDNETVRVDIGRADLYDDRTKSTTPEAFTGNFVYDRPRLPIGHLLLRFGAPLTDGSGRLSLWNAEATYNVTIKSSSGPALATSLRVWASAEHALADVVVLEIGGSERPVDVRWVADPGDSFWMPRNSKYVPNPVPRTATHVTREGGTLNITTQMHLRGTAHSTAVLQLPNQSGIVLSVSPVSKSALAANTWASTQVSNVVAAGIADVRAAHHTWWHAFWPAGGFVTFEYTVMESLYLLMQYKFASAARRGRAFMDLNGPWLVSVDGGTNAPDVHWDWNIQGMYYMPFLTNRPEIANSLIDYVENLLHSGVLWSSYNVQPGWEDSAAAPTGASGLDGQQSCYWNYGVNCTVSPPSVTGNLLWTLHVVHQSGIYQGNATVSTAVVWPLLCRALRFYGHFLVENTTHITLPPTFSPEYPGPAGPNANYDLALLRWGVRTAIHLTKQHKLPALPADKSLWQRIEDKLIGPSLDGDGRFAIYEGTPYAKPHRHFSHLLPLWPLRELSNLSDPLEYRRAVASVDLWSSMPELFSLFGRPACASMNADLGRYAAALDNMSYFVRTRVEGSGWYWEGAATACNEAPYMAAYTLADWLLQSWNETFVNGTRVKIIQPFRGIPDSVRLDGSAYDAAPAGIATGSFYRLAAEGGFLVSAVRDRVNPDNISVYEAKTRFVAIESTIGGPCVLRTSMQRPLLSHPPGVQLKELGHELVQIGIEKGESVAIWGGDSTVSPALTVQPKVGCKLQRNYWGGGVVPQSEQRKAPAPPSTETNRTVLRPCMFGADGALVSSQRWRKLARPNGSVAFELQDGSQRCLSVANCANKDGPAVLRTCIQYETISKQGLPIGCQRPWTQMDEWPRTNASDPSASCTAASQEFVVGGVAPHFWRNALQLRESNSCLDLHGGKDPETISLDGCQNCTASRQCTVDNTEWHYNASSMGLVSLCKSPCRAGGWCLTDASGHRDQPAPRHR